MFISHTHKLVFLEVPRTASRAITSALAALDPYSPSLISQQLTGTSTEARAYHCEELNDPEYRVIAVRRNPYERIWSHWKYRVRWGEPQALKMVSWPTYVDWLCDPSLIPDVEELHVDIPVTEMFDPARVDFWLEFAQLEQDWHKLAIELDVQLPGLEKLNASPDHGHLSNGYTPTMANKIYRRFQKDFDYFKYPENAWHTLAAPADIQAIPDDPQAGPVTCNRKPRVAILSTFSNNSHAHSLLIVVRDQLSMLIKHGYTPVLFVMASDYWNAPTGLFANPDIEIVQLPAVRWVLNKGEEGNLLSDIEKIKAVLGPSLRDTDIVFTHDIIYQPLYLTLSIAARHIARELPHLKWLHWIHSATSPKRLPKEGLAEDLYDDVLNELWPNSYLVHFTQTAAPRIAAGFGRDISEVKCLPNPIDICSYLGVSDLTQRVYEQKRLYQADYVSVYPTRLDRGKQVEWVIAILARLKAMGNTVRLVVMDFHSQSIQKDAYRNDLKQFAKDWGLSGEDLTFLSEFDDSLRDEAPRQMVKELFQISNLFIHPSRSEGYSLVAQEAALCGNLLMLNDDFPAFQEVFGSAALYAQFSSNVNKLTLAEGETELRFGELSYDSPPQDVPASLIFQREGKWWVSGEVAHAHAQAGRIAHEFETNKVLQQHQRRYRDRNIFSVFQRQLEPLIYTMLATESLT